MTKRALARTFIDCDPTSIHRTMAIGDSITIGASTGGWRVPLFAANPGLTFVGREYLYGFNEGWNGFRIDQISTQVLPIIDFFAPDTILLLAGTNDINQGQSGASTATEQLAFADALKAKASVNNVLIGTIPYLNAQPVQQAAYNTALLAASPPAGITVHDVSSTVIYPTDYQDALHPNAAGYAKMGVLWDVAVKLILY